MKGVISAALQPDAAQRWGHDGLDKVLDSLDDPRNIDELLRISTLVDSHDVHLDLEEQNGTYSPSTLLYVTSGVRWPD